ncbi:hypothetical protein GCM10010324_32730 [Streptomyces hiroshimensis]|uniref:DUF397 domain-containing protein n=2 Tax=Streptomyces hiroshimensis TaxID=66424 RepID=A0ABQ2YHH9_9ACTN|nr:hypothetical protein GCM10010324_32730 [Streptomyces hiroshimensis]
MKFKKSSYSATVEDCVEIALAEDTEPVLIRDSKRPGGPTLRFAAAPYRSFTRAVRERELGTP